ncbi:MAG: DNA recombination protein RmuC [Clostridiales bacterium]|nr:DNA recombination protein RmuC [Clostridiales bacterium]
MEIIIILLAVLIVLSLISVILLIVKKNDDNEGLTKKDKTDIISSFSSNVSIISSALQKTAEYSNKETKVNLEYMSERLKESRKTTEYQLATLEKKLSDSLEQIRQTLERNVQTMAINNEKKLSEIQKTVDENLTKTLNERFNESFKMLLAELERVSKTIGEMQKISSEVGVLSKMLSNVKTTGILGEIQLGAIIDELLSPEQYVKNVVTGKNSREPVEFAVKLPGGDEGEVLLPIDSKFPYTIYAEMQSLYETGEFSEFEIKKKQLINTVKSMAKDIKDKYINPPRTTNFAIMFLPVEGLYAEIVKLGLVDELQRKFSITVAGPTTMAALLNSLQMGFQTLSIQKKSNEVWEILGAVKQEFSKFGTIIEGIQKKLNGASSDLDQLIGVRTRAIDRSLRNVTARSDISILPETINED